MPKGMRGGSVVRTEPSTTTRIRWDTISRLRIVRAEESRLRGRYVSIMDLLEELTSYAEDRLRRTKDRLKYGELSQMDTDALSNNLVHHSPVEMP
jgi:hypothetical protein